MAAPAKSATRRFRVDARFLIGVALIAASVIGVLAIVATADRSVTAYAVRDTATTGDLLELDDLVEVSVRLDASEGRYVLEGDVPDEGFVVARSIAAGELVPLSAIGTVAGERVAAIVVALASPLPSTVEAGTVVDVWSSRELDDGSFGPPTVLVSSATVVRIVEDDGLVVGASDGAVEVLVPKSRIARVLEAIANDAALSIVPVSIPVRG